LNITLQSMGDGLIATNENGLIEVMNKVAEDITGWTVSEAYGKPLYEVLILSKPLVRRDAGSVEQL